MAAASGDALALRLLEDAGRALAAGCVSLVNAFNPCRLILGGGVIDGVPGLIEGCARASGAGPACGGGGRRGGARPCSGQTPASVGAGSLALRRLERRREA